MIYENSLLSSVCKLISHYDSCSFCGKALIEDVLHPSLLKILSHSKQSCRPDNSDLQPCEGKNIRQNFRRLLAVITTSISSSSSIRPIARSISSNSSIRPTASPISNHDLHEGTELSLNDSSSASTEDRVNSPSSFCTSSDVSDPFPLPMIEKIRLDEVSKSRNLSEGSIELSEDHLTSTNEISFCCDTAALESEPADDLFDENLSHSTIEIEAQADTLLHSDITEEILSVKSMPALRPIGRNALRNALLNEENSRNLKCASISSSTKGALDKVSLNKILADDLSDQANVTYSLDSSFETLHQSRISDGASDERHVSYIPYLIMTIRLCLPLFKRLLYLFFFILKYVTFNSM